MLTVINRSSARLSVVSPEGFSVVLGGRGLKTAFAVRPLGGIVIKVACWDGEPCRMHFVKEIEKSTDKHTAVSSISYQPTPVG